MTRWIAPRPSESLSPPAASETSRRAPSSTSMLTTTSRSLATSATVTAGRAPAAASASTCAATTSKTTSSWPASSRRRAIPCPIRPRPTNPTFISDSRGRGVVGACLRSPCSRHSLLVDDLAAFDGHHDVQQVGARFERVAVDQDDVRELAGLERAELVALQRRRCCVLRQDRHDVLRRKRQPERAQLVD